MMHHRRLFLAVAILCAAAVATSYALQRVAVLPADFRLRDLTGVGP